MKITTLWHFPYKSWTQRFQTLADHHHPPPIAPAPARFWAEVQKNDSLCTSHAEAARRTWKKSNEIGMFQKKDSPMMRHARALTKNKLVTTRTFMEAENEMMTPLMHDDCFNKTLHHPHNMGMLRCHAWTLPVGHLFLGLLDPGNVRMSREFWTYKITESCRISKKTKHQIPHQSQNQPTQQGDWQETIWRYLKD